MKAAVAVVVGLITGLVVGIVLSEIIGVAGFVLTRRAVGIKYLPIYLAIAFAVAAPIVRARISRETPRQ
jgi:multisubunit Na+/H+ antiporter MnhE subunit